MIYTTYILYIFYLFLERRSLTNVITLMRIVIFFSQNYIIMWIILLMLLPYIKCDDTSAAIIGDARPSRIILIYYYLNPPSPKPLIFYTFIVYNLYYVHNKIRNAIGVVNILKFK